MPYYGHPGLLLRAVRSVQALQETAWRLVIVEDDHPEGLSTERTIRDLGDSRIEYRRNARNLGVSRNTFQCMQWVEADHFVLMDYDDLLLPNYGTAVAELFRRCPDAVIVQPGVTIIDEDDQHFAGLPDRIKKIAGPINRDAELRGEAAVVSLLRGNWTYAPSICYRKSAAKELSVRPETDAVHDLARLVDLMVSGGSLAVGSQIAFRYRRHRNSHSSVGARHGQRFAQERRFYHQMAQEMGQLGWASAQRAARLRLFSRLNAMAQIPGAVLKRRSTVAAMLTHAFG